MLASSWGDETQTNTASCSRFLFIQAEGTLSGRLLDYEILTTLFELADYILIVYFLVLNHL